MRAAFESEGQAVEESVKHLRADLEEEGLIVPPGGREPADDGERSPVGSLPMPGSRGAAFAPPALERFTNMQELILLDSVHEVEEDKGWPHAKPAE